jgi:hypothetical protein
MEVYAENETRGINGFVLKMIAIITMLIDHTAAVLIPDNTQLYVNCRIIGRLAFPIFSFLLVEGYLHTKNIRKYFLRLGIFAMISEIPFDLAFSENSSSYLYHQNIFFTLLIGLGVIYVIGIIDLKYVNNKVIRFFADILVIFAGCVIADMLATDYGKWGILIISAFYIFRRNKILLLAAIFLVNYASPYLWQVYAAVSMLFIWFYNGKRGPQGNKYFFYAFYPTHIFVLYLISLLPFFN